MLILDYVSQTQSLVNSLLSSEKIDVEKKEIPNVP
jgi:hypothetical protein